MMFDPFVYFAAAVFCAGLAGFGLFRDHRSMVHQVFAGAMLALALEAVFVGLSLRAIFSEDILFWQQWRWKAASLLPGSWLLFSLRFSQSDNSSGLGRWKWFVLPAFVVPLCLSTLFARQFFSEGRFLDGPRGWFFSLGWLGMPFKRAS